MNDSHVYPPTNTYVFVGLFDYLNNDANVYLLHFQLKQHIHLGAQFVRVYMTCKMRSR